MQVGQEIRQVIRLPTEAKPATEDQPTDPPRLAVRLTRPAPCLYRAHGHLPPAHALDKNYVGFLAGQTVQSGGQVRSEGLHSLTVVRADSLTVSEFEGTEAIDDCGSQTDEKKLEEWPLWFQALSFQSQLTLELLLYCVVGVVALMLSLPGDRILCNEEELRASS